MLVTGSWTVYKVFVELRDVTAFLTFPSMGVHCLIFPLTFGLVCWGPGGLRVDW